MRQDLSDVLPDDLDENNDTSTDPIPAMMGVAAQSKNVCMEHRDRWKLTLPAL